jgi:hypothetical protein
MKEDHHARKAEKPNSADGSKIGRVRADGIIDSDSEDERVVQAAKRKSPSTSDQRWKERSSIKNKNRCCSSVQENENRCVS